MIYLDNAATTFPKPPSVYRGLREDCIKYGANPGRSGHPMANATLGAVYDVREKLAQLFGCTRAENVAFTLNTTHALCIAVHSAVTQKSKVVTSFCEHNSVLRPLYATGCDISFFKCDLTDEQKTVDSFLAASKGCDVAVLGLCSNVSGKLLPYEKICGICKKRGITVIADGAQCAGYYKINMHKLSIDMLCVPCHKGLYGICGAGAIVVSERWQDRMKPLITGGGGGMSKSREMPPYLPDKLEAGTLPVLPILSVGRGIDFINEVGMEELCYRSHTAASACRELLGNMKGVDIYPSFGNIVLFNVQNAPSVETEGLLGDMGIGVRGGFHCAPLMHSELLHTPDGAVRASFGAFNTVKDANMLKKCLEKIKKF